VTFAGWPSSRKLSNERQGLRAAEPGHQGELHALDLQLYNEKMVALFNARAGAGRIL